MLLGLWLRYPLIGADLPYFYQEDEGHHFNRLVEMVKDGDFNPHYFNKPSLHFYLRMPAVVASFLWSVRADEITSIQDIVTRDEAGLSGYAWSASHPRIVRWVRSVSTIFSLLTIWVTYLLAVRLVDSRRMAVAAALLVACSPALVSDSAKIGVDTLMMLMCVTTVYLALRMMAKPTVVWIIATGLVAGLAVSSKYNALPIAAVPALACLLSRRCSAAGLAAALVAPVVGFCVGTPFALVQLPALLDGMAYEIRHYGILGHGAATVEPGWPHATVFMKWMRDGAVGLLPTVMGLAGGGLLMWRRPRVGLLVLFFPMGYLLLMVSQRVGLMRNMLVMIPFFCILAAWTAELAVRSMSGLAWVPRRITAVLAPAVVLVISAQSLTGAVGERHDRSAAAPDSRELLSQWLEETSDPTSDIAIAAELQFPPAAYAASGVTRIRTDEIDPVSLFLNGFDRVVVGPEFDADGKGAMMLPEVILPGQRKRQRVRRNPEITVYVFPDVHAEATSVRSYVASTPRLSVRPTTLIVEPTIALVNDRPCAPTNSSDRSPTSGLDDCLVQSRVARIVLDRGAVTMAAARGRHVLVTLDLRTPWRSQSCRLKLAAWDSHDLCTNLEPGKWEQRSVSIPTHALSGSDALWIVIGQVHALSPPHRSEGPIRVGLWVRTVALSVAPQPNTH